VVLGLRASAKVGETTAFMAELDYAAVISLAPGLSEEARERLVMVEVPRHIFPFARAILADDTRDGGFPPLMMSPIDFAQLYLSRRAQSQEPAAQGEAEANGKG
jgi:preprotein translocase subunit SecB